MSPGYYKTDESQTCTPETNNILYVNWIQRKNDYYSHLNLNFTSSRF